MGQILAITNQKGGVGKTTTCINLAASLAVTKKRVLLIDFDPQGNATMGSGIDKINLEYSVYHLLMEECTFSQARQFSESGKFDVLPANGDLTAAEVELLAVDKKEFRLQRILHDIDDNYDYVLIDCPPSLNMLTVNALACCNGVIIPMQCEYYALEGLSALIDTIDRIRLRLNPELSIAGILRTMYDPRSSLTVDVSDQLVNFFGDRLYRTCIPRNVRLAEAPSYGQPAIVYDRQSKGAVAYLALAGECIRRAELHQQHGSQKV